MYVCLNVGRGLENYQAGTSPLTDDSWDRVQIPPNPEQVEVVTDTK